jgi:hypothetical protein
MIHRGELCNMKHKTHHGATEFSEIPSGAREPYGRDKLSGIVNAMNRSIVDRDWEK